MRRYEGYDCRKCSFQANERLTFTGLHPFAAWNLGVRVATKNCYALAAGAFAPDILELMPNGGKARVYLPGPGTTGGKLFRAVSQDALYEGLVADGFLPVADCNWKKLTIPSQHYLIACYYTKRDFLFYRFHKKEGLWYTKIGTDGPVTNRDFGGKPIRDVEKADRGPYAGVVGFFLSPPDRKPLDIVVEDAKRKVLWRGNRPGVSRKPRKAGPSLG